MKSKRKNRSLEEVMFDLMENKNYENLSTSLRWNLKFQCFNISIWNEWKKIIISQDAGNALWITPNKLIAIINNMHEIMESNSTSFMK